MRPPNRFKSLRKTPTQPRAQATVDTLLEATAQVMETDGERASTNRIAERAGFSIGTLYQYFPNREAMLSAIVAREQAKLVAAIRGALVKLDPDHPERAVREAVKLFLHAFDGRTKLRRQIVMKLAGNASAMLRQQAEVMDAAMGDVLAAVEARHPGRMRRLNHAERYVLTRAVASTVRTAIIEGAPSLRDPAFEDALVRLITSYISN